MPTLRLSAVAALLLSLAAPASAQDRVLLSEIVPALDGTELGMLEVGDAPPPGSNRTVRRSEVLRALSQAARSPQGLSIPRATRISREARSLDEDALIALSREAVSRALSPCRVDEMSAPREISVTAGRLTVRADGEAPARSGSVSAIVILEGAGREVRVPVRAQVSCPPPAIQPGSRVRINVTINNVRASAPGEARQPGRVGDLVRVTNTATRRTLVARVVDGGTVELLR